MPEEPGLFGNVNDSLKFYFSHCGINESGLRYIRLIATPMYAKKETGTIAQTLQEKILASRVVSATSILVTCIRCHFERFIVFSRYIASCGLHFRPGSTRYVGI